MIFLFLIALGFVLLVVVDSQSVPVREREREGFRRGDLKIDDWDIDHFVKPVCSPRLVVLRLVDQRAVRVTQLPMSFDKKAPRTARMKLNLEAPETDQVELLPDETV